MLFCSELFSLFFVFLWWIWHTVSLFLGVFRWCKGLFLERFEQKNVNSYANCDENE